MGVAEVRRPRVLEENGAGPGKWVLPSPRGVCT